MIIPAQMDYRSMNVNGLKDECKRMGIGRCSKARRDELIDALENNRPNVVTGVYSNIGQGRSRDRLTYNNVGQSSRGRVGQARDDLYLKTVYELKSMARDLGLQVTGMTKDEIISKIRGVSSVGGSRDRVGQVSTPMDMNSMTKMELMAYAKKMGVTGYSKDTKSELIARIQRQVGWVGQGRQSSRGRYSSRGMY